MRAHKLKTWPEPFREVEAERKTCELRKADRDYRVGDFLMLLEYDPKTDSYTGRHVERRITHILTGDVVPRGLIDGFVVLSIEPADSYEQDALLGQNKHLGHVVQWLKAT